jgi:23S rRNA (uridine2552-2'-O)-methyltransferase
MSMAKARLDDRSTRRDRFHQKAKRDGFVARSVYKLEEIDEKTDLFSEGDRVLDLGCAPGSWLQYARKQIGESGILVGLDRPSGIGNMRNFPARLHTGDVMTISIDELKGDLTAFDIVLSDMAPDTTGIRSLDQARSEALFERALEIAKAVLAPGGNFVGKLFQGPDFKKLTEDVRKSFTKMKTVKPASSRQISIEQFVVGMGYRGSQK